MKPKTWVHIWLAVTIAWIILAIPSLIWWSQSIAWLVFMSAWANIAASAAAWQAAKADAS